MQNLSDPQVDPPQGGQSTGQTQINEILTGGDFLKIVISNEAILGG